MRQSTLGYDHHLAPEPPSDWSAHSESSMQAESSPPRPNRIVFVAWRDLANPSAGGSELLVHEIASGLASRGYDVTLLCGDPVEPQSLYRVMSSGGRFSQYLRAPLRYLRKLRDADLVVEVCNGMPFLVPLWRRGPSLCLINHVHTEQWREFFNPVIALFGRTTEAKVMPWVHRNNLIVTISPSTRASLSELNISEDRLREIPQGCVTPPALLPKSPTPLFVAVGRLVGYKRVDLLLKLWRSVYPVTGGKLVVVGDGADRESLEALKSEGVEFTGFVTEAEKHRLMCESWVLLHTAAWEGWGLVITEAAVRGTPAVGFDVPGVRDAIVDGKTGLLASTEADFVRDWIRLVHDETLRAELGEASRIRARGIPWTGTVDAFEDVASEAVALHEAKRPSRLRVAHASPVDP